MLQTVSEYLLAFMSEGPWASEPSSNPREKIPRASSHQGPPMKPRPVELLGGPWVVAIIT